MTRGETAPVLRFVSVTRFRLRSIRFAPSFMLHATRTIAQIRKADGFMAGAVRREVDLAFWTLTMWRDEHAMRAYAGSGAHRNAMLHLSNWADEARVGHWQSSANDLPEWPEAIRRLREQGRPAALRHPAPSHSATPSAEAQMTYGLRLWPKAEPSRRASLPHDRMQALHPSDNDNSR